MKHYAYIVLFSAMLTSLYIYPKSLEESIREHFSNEIQKNTAMSIEETQRALATLVQNSKIRTQQEALQLITLTKQCVERAETIDQLICKCGLGIDDTISSIKKAALRKNIVSAYNEMEKNKHTYEAKHSHKSSSPAMLTDEDMTKSLNNMSAEFKEARNTALVTLGAAEKYYTSLINTDKGYDQESADVLKRFLGFSTDQALLEYLSDTLNAKNLENTRRKILGK